ncbi:MAG: dTDP-4-dehydrorhamnose reductase [Bacteroidota bacterium]
MKKILVIGASGQVGSELKRLAANHNNFVFQFETKDTLDISQQDSIEQFFSTQKIDFCINCAAYTAVDKAESEPEMAKRINIDGPKWIAEACAVKNIPLIHFSSDYVYHNSINRPLIESDPTTPQGIYAQTKLDGDQAIMDTNAKAIILRTSWVYSSYGKNFVKTMIRLGNDRDQLNVVFDQIGSPTYAFDLAKASLDLITQANNNSDQLKEWNGVYHYSNEGVCSWYDFALAIFDIKAIECDVKPIESKDYPTPASRPNYSVLNKEKFKSTFQLEIPHWRESLKACLKKMV